MPSINDLKQDHKNARKRTDRSAKLIAESLERYGAARSIVIDEENRILAGNGTIEGAKQAGIKNVRIIETDGTEVIAVKRTGLTEDEKIGLALADNRTSDLSDWDAEMLQQLSEEHDISPWFEGNDLSEIIGKVEQLPAEGLTDADDVPEAPEEPVTKLGDLWVLGDHRLLCGDSTDALAVERLMDGKAADLIHTDPPYGIGYGGSMKLGQAKHGWKQHRGGWDEERPPKDFFDFALLQCENIIIWGGNYFADCLPPSMGWLVWDKGQRGFSLADGEMAWTSFNNAMRIKEYARAKANQEEKHHATQKPIELIEWCFEYADRHSKRKPSLVLDFFGGSGSTLIACEKTGRHARLMELDPRYCDVIVKRWEDFTGKKAILEEVPEAS
jgi:DNA modification methylase